MFENGATAHRIARESRVTSYSAGQTAWTEVHALKAGGFEVTKGREWYDRGGARDYEWETTQHATRDEAFAVAGIADPAAAAPEPGADFLFRAAQLSRALHQPAA